MFFLVAMPHVFRLIDLSQSPGGLLRSQGESCCKMMTSGRSGTLLFWAWKAAEAGVWWWQGNGLEPGLNLGKLNSFGQIMVINNAIYWYILYYLTCNFS
jgi:hypothetical protein